MFSMDGQYTHTHTQQTDTHMIHDVQKFLRLFRLIEFTLNGDDVPYVGTWMLVVIADSMRLMPFCVYAKVSETKTTIK